MLRIDSADFLDAAETEASIGTFGAMLAPLPERSPYQASHRHDLPAGILSVGMVAALLAGLAWMHVAPSAHGTTRLLVLDLKSAPPPPRPVEKVRQRIVPHQAQPIAAPPPIVPIAAPSPVIAVANPVPAPPVVAPPAPVVAPAAPAAVVATTPVEAGDLSSRMLSAKPPAYPLDSRRKAEEGVVVLTVLLGIDGRVADIAVAQSSGFDRLDQAALSAVRQWRWAPIVRNGAAVSVQGRVKIPFVLKR